MLKIQPPIIIPTIAKPTPKYIQLAKSTAKRLTVYSAAKKSVKHDPTIKKRKKSIKASKARLKERLDYLNLSESEVKGDGNCQFRSFSQTLFGSQERKLTKTIYKRFGLTPRITNQHSTL